MASDDDRELVAGEVVGWRSWGVYGRPVGFGSIKDPVLFSLFNDTEWPADDWLYAECLDLNSVIPSARACKEIPGKGCHCGVYAARDRRQLAGLRQYGDPNGQLYTQARPLTVIGEVALAGLIYPGSRGWRAARARVLRLYVPHEHWPIVHPLQETYNVSVELSNTMRVKGDDGYRRRI